MIVFPWFQIYEVLPPPFWLIDADVVGGLGGHEEDVKSISEDVGSGADDDDELEK